MSQVSTSYASAKGCSRCSLETAGYERRDSITGCGEERAAKDYKYILKEWIALECALICYSNSGYSFAIHRRATRAGLAPENFVIVVGMGEL